MAGFLLKIFLWIIGFILAIGAVLLATALSLVLGVFAYPLALKRSFRATSDVSSSPNSSRVSELESDDSISSNL